MPSACSRKEGTSADARRSAASSGSTRRRAGPLTGVELVGWGATLYFEKPADKMIRVSKPKPEPVVVDPAIVDGTHQIRLGGDRDLGEIII